MKIDTKFSNGDTVYGVQKAYITDSWQVIGPMTIGQVRVEITDSPGIEGETMFDNYKAQKDYKEQYMCIETGIGTGTLHSSDHIFASVYDAAAYAESKNKICQ